MTTAVPEQSQSIPTMEKIQPRCPVFGRCGGCFYQDVPYTRELENKEKRLRELFAGRFPDFDQDLLEAVTPSPKPYHYRHRLDLQARRLRTGELILGFTPVEGRGIVAVDSCPIAREEISDFIPELKRQVKSRWPEKYKRANLVVRSGEEGAVRWGGLGRRSLRLEDKDYFWTEIEGRKIFYSLETFFQANLSILPSVMAKIKGLGIVTPQSTFFDLYGGVGLFGIALYNEVKKVVLIEDNIHAVQLAQFNRDYHQLTAFEIYSGRVEGRLSEIVDKEPGPEQVILVDPPRAGLSHSACTEIGGIAGLKSLLYLSCHPESLLRDLGDLVAMGWRIVKVIPFDFFPKTKHIETLVVLQPRKEWA